jgi:hypothetical protein
MKHKAAVTMLLAGLSLPAKAELPEGWPPPLPVNCQMVHVDEEVDTLKKVPPAVMAEYNAKLAVGYPTSAPLIVDRGETYNSTDVVMGSLSNRRFVEAGRLGTKWFVWYEQGGRGNHLAVAVFDVRPDGSSTFVSKSPAYDDICQATQALLEGKPYGPKRP